MSATYYETAADCNITWERAMAELRSHGADDRESVEAFGADVWDRHSHHGRIAACRVLEWLGY